MAEMALGYGSEFQLLRFLGHHRNELNKEICKEIGDGEIEWLDYPYNSSRISSDGELKGVECFKSLPNYNIILEEWKKFWPQSGNAHNWDGVFKQNAVWYLVEAKAHLDEADQKCHAVSNNSIEQIVSAFTETCGDSGLAKKWKDSKCYQLANRLAFIHFCKKMGIKAKLVYINFVNGYLAYPKYNVKSAKEWSDKWEEEFQTLKLTPEQIEYIFLVTIDCMK